MLPTLKKSSPAIYKDVLLSIMVTISCRFDEKSYRQKDINDALIHQEKLLPLLKLMAKEIRTQKSTSEIYDLLYILDQLATMDEAGRPQGLKYAVFHLITQIVTKRGLNYIHSYVLDRIAYLECKYHFFDPNEPRDVKMATLDVHQNDFKDEWKQFISSKPQSVQVCDDASTKMKLPTNLEQYSLRLSHFVESLNDSAYVNYHHLFFLRAHQSEADEKVLKIYNIHLNAIMKGGKREIKQHRAYNDISFLTVVKSFIDPRFYENEKDMNNRQSEIVKVVTFLEALMDHINDTSAADHWKRHQEFFKGNQQPLVDLYHTMVSYAEEYADNLKDFRITTYEPFPHISELDDNLLDMFSVLDEML